MLIIIPFSMEKSSKKYYSIYRVLAQMLKNEITIKKEQLK